MEREREREQREMTEEETETSQTIKETQTFVIRGVIDPRTDEEISIYMVRKQVNKQVNKQINK